MRFVVSKFKVCVLVFVCFGVFVGWEFGLVWFTLGWYGLVCAFASLFVSCAGLFALVA